MKVVYWRRLSIGESENSICMTNSCHKIIQICMFCCTISSTILLYSPVPSFQNYQFQDVSALFVITTPIKTYSVIMLSITSMTADSAVQSDFKQVEQRPQWILSWEIFWVKIHIPHFCTFLRDSASSFHWLSSFWWKCTGNISAHLHYMMFPNIQTIYFLWGNDSGNTSVSTYLLLLSWA